MKRSDIMGLLLIGLIFVSVGFVGLKKTSAFFKKAILVKGVVIDAIPNKRNSAVMSYNGRLYQPKGRGTYTPLVRYEFEGQTHEVQGSVYTSSIPKMGKQMTVGIDPDNLLDVRLKESNIIYFIFMIVGAGLSLCGGLALFQK